SDAGLRTQDFLKVGGAAALMAVVSYGAWRGLASFVQPSSLPGELVLLGVPALLGGGLYAALVWMMRLPELRLIMDKLAARLKRCREARPRSARPSSPAA